MLSNTQDEIAEKVFSLLGKGKRHAALLYAQWMREGHVDASKWAEPQALALVEEISQIVDLSLPPISNVHKEEGVTKFLLRLPNGLETESVAIPMEFGNTLCISSQVGCKMGCAFCETGRMGLLKNLSAQEIVAQLFIARFRLNIPIRNLVFMGMGEPFDNYEEVMKAIGVFLDPAGIGMGQSRITLSTSGHVPHLYRFMEEAPAALNLAVSVNAPNDTLRNRLMPINKKWNMAALKEAMKSYCAHPRREILIEYVLLKDVNDSLEAADELAAYLSSLRVKVNLIAYNSQSRSRFSPPPLSVQEAFAARLRTHGYLVLLRHHKGRAIMAACGQLGNIEARLSKIPPT